MSKGFKVIVGILFLGVGLYSLCMSMTHDYRKGLEDGTPLIVIGVMSGALGGLILFLATRRPSLGNCPHCSSAKLVRPMPKEAMGHVGWLYIFFPLIRCSECGHLWEPPLPRWLLAVYATIGGFLVWSGICAFGALVLGGLKKGSPMDAETTTAIPISVAFILGGLAVIRGCVKRMAKDRGVHPPADRHSGNERSSPNGENAGPCTSRESKGAQDPK